MRKLHRTVGIITVVAFLLTGQYMGHHAPPMAALSDSTRLMFRSRHIYILASGLVNLMLGLYVHRHARGWRRSVQAAGSALLILSPALLILAFTLEPARGFNEQMHSANAGLFALFLGGMAHFICGPPIR